MNCLYCGIELAPLRSLQYGEYCSDEHYVESACTDTAADYLILLDPPEAVPPRKQPRPSIPAFRASVFPIRYPLLKRTPVLEPGFALGAMAALPLSAVAGESVVRVLSASDRPVRLKPVLALQDALSPVFDTPLKLPLADFRGGLAPTAETREIQAQELAIGPRFAPPRPSASFDGVPITGAFNRQPLLQLAGLSEVRLPPRPSEPKVPVTGAAPVPLSPLPAAAQLPSLKTLVRRELVLPWGSIADLSIFPNPSEPKSSEPVLIPWSPAQILELPKVRLLPSTPTFRKASGMALGNELDLRRLFTSTPRRNWGSMFRRWLEVPRYLKILASLVPVVLAAMLASAGSRSGAINRVSQDSVLSHPVSSLKATLRQRAAVILSDDFREGMDKWRTRGELAAPWTIDNAGFLHPGVFATFAPSTDLSDYNLEFQVQVERHALGVAFRVQGSNDYYVVKVPQPATSTSPAGDIVWYKVVAGRETGRVAHPFPKGVPRNSLQTVRLDVSGSDFTLISEGKVVDYWSDGRFRKGGVGFFCTKGDRARVRWVEVRHQDDFVGRLCALLAPPEAQIGNRNRNQK